MDGPPPVHWAAPTSPYSTGAAFAEAGTISIIPFLYVN